MSSEPGHRCRRCVEAYTCSSSRADDPLAIRGDNDFDGAAVAAVAETEAVADEFAANTAEAIELGVFGSPSYVYSGELFCEWDRLDFFARALANDGG